MRTFAVKYIMEYVGKWYKWGGDDPSGFDCSGLAVEMLKSVGLLKRREDLTAEGLYHRFSDKSVSEAHPGCLVFYGTRAGRINHVEIAIFDGTLCLGASGGGSKTLTEADAIRQNAFVKVRPLKRERNVIAIVDPF